MNISPNVKIMTAEEYAASGDAAFKRGVERGKFEAESARNKEAPTGVFEFGENPGRIRFIPMPPVPAPHRPVLHCYFPQRNAIHDAFGRPFDMRLRTVVDETNLRGTVHGVFIVADDHSESVPHEIWRELCLGGWTIIRIDSSYALAKASR